MSQQDSAPTDQQERVSPPGLETQAKQRRQAFGDFTEKITPWLFAVGNWVFGGLIAFNLLIVAALLTVGPVHPAILISVAIFAIALPLDVAGLFLLKLVQDMNEIAIDDLNHWVGHLNVLRGIQDQTGGFTEFVPLPFVHMATPIFLQRKTRPGPTFREVLLMHAVARIAYHGVIDNIQASWVKCGVRGAQQILQAGANDLGGTLMDENISRAAGANHGQELDDAQFAGIVTPIGRTLAQRTTLYGRTITQGRRLRPIDDDGLAAHHGPVDVTLGRKPAALPL